MTLTAWIVVVWLLLVCQPAAVFTTNHRVPPSRHIVARKARLSEGAVAHRRQFPYQAYLVDSKRCHEYFCGAAILDGQTVVTAARCVHNRNRREVNIVHAEVLLKPHKDATPAGKIV